MKQFQVPQFIDVEDKILGFVTMRQFFIMLIPLTVAGVLYFILDIWLMLIITLPVTGIAVVFAFYKPNGMKFSRFLGSFLSYTFKPRLYVWKREEKTTSVEILREGEEKLKTPGGLKSKKGSIETGSKINEEELKKQGGESEYLDEILNESAS